VVFTNQINREEVRDLYHACDVLLHPIKPQGGWLSPFEALCAQKLIIVSPEMSASDIIEKEKIGIVTDNYTEAIIKIYKNVDEYANMRERGREWVKNNLNWDTFCQKNLNIFQKASKPK